MRAQVRGNGCAVVSRLSVNKAEGALYQTSNPQNHQIDSNNQTELASAQRPMKSRRPTRPAGAVDAGAAAGPTMDLALGRTASLAPRGGASAGGRLPLRPPHILLS